MSAPLTPRAALATEGPAQGSSVRRDGRPSTVDGPGPRFAAVIAGIGYLAIFGLAIFANFGVRNRLVDLTDPSGTLANLAAEEGIVRVALAAFVSVFVIDVVVAWALHVLLRTSAPTWSLLAAWSRLSYTVLLGVAAVFLFLAMRLAGAGGYASGITPQLRAALAATSLDAFDYAWLVGLVAFGLHLLVVGGILIGTRVGPRWLGVLLGIAGAAYIADTAAHTLLAGYAAYADAFLAMVALPSIVGELWLTVWLLARAGRRKD